MIITSEGLMYTRGLNDDQKELRENLLFDHHYKLEYGKKETNREFGLNLTYSNRILHLEALNLFSFLDIVASLKEAEKNSYIVRKNRFSSFAPIRENVTCKWYIDGYNYFNDVCEELLNAKEEVLITDWWLSPELHLKRPVGEGLNDETMLMDILTVIATRGVNVKIIVYKESTMVLTNDSFHTKYTLTAKHKNILVLRHPGYFLPNFLWSHHEKMVVIDQKIGFLGGLDLCFGRMDTQDHNLFDKSLFESGDQPKREFFPGIDYSNSRKKDFFKVKDYKHARIDKLTTPRMPWHDISMKVEGNVVQDMSRHFIQYWNFAKYDLDTTKKKQPVLIKKFAPLNLEVIPEKNEKNEKTSKIRKYWDETKKRMNDFKEKKVDLLKDFYKKHKKQKQDEYLHEKKEERTDFDLYLENIKEAANKDKKKTQ